MNILAQEFEHQTAVLWDLTEDLLGDTIVGYLTLRGGPKLLSLAAALAHIPTSNVWATDDPTSFATVCCFPFCCSYCNKKCRCIVMFAFLGYTVCWYYPSPFLLPSPLSIWGVLWFLVCLVFWDMVSSSFCWLYSLGWPWTSDLSISTCECWD